MWKKFTLILWKNLIIRKRHWLLTLVEVLIPIVLFSLVAYGRSKISSMNKIHIDEPTYYDISDTGNIYSHLDVGELNLWYSPHKNFTEKIISKVQDKLQIPGDRVKEFASYNELLLQFGRNSTTLIAAINFKGNDPHHLNYDLTIYDKYFTWSTDKLFIPMFTPEDGRSSKYIYNGFAALQVAIDLSFMEYYSDSDQQKDLKTIDFSLQQFPDPPRTIDSGMNQLFIYFLPIVTIFSFVFLCPAVLQRVGEEKSSGTKEYMKMVGLKSSLIWLGWFIHALTTNIFSIIIIVVLMKVPFWGVSYPPIEHSDGTVLFSFLFLYCMAAITFCFLIASIFNTPSISTVIGILLWLFSYFIPQSFISSHEELLWKCKIPFAFLPNMALYYGYSSISVYEMRELGIQWNNIFEPGSGDDNDITMGNVFIMLICDMILFMTLTLYIENVKPGEYGISKPYSFPVTNFLSKCFMSLKRCFVHRIQNASENKLLDDAEKGLTSTPKACIRIKNLQKKYAHHVAVDDLTMDIYKNQITVLLGQNGAGKTTTMSILTGMINATDGVVLINDKNIKTHTDDVRQLMGLCPQHNLLFPDLTVREHLKFFAKLKGSQDCNSDAKNMLETLGIAKQSNDMTNVLSGGMKRKLCLGMALIGNSEVLILDEPTSGMDPESRRKIWNLLIEFRKNKTILITTHFMEEADALGEWIAIMANGRLQCYSTPLKLKADYNTGYHLNLLLGSNSDKCEIEKIVKQHFPQVAEIRRETSEDSIVYLLPLGQGVKYAPLIDALERNKNALGIHNIAMDITTLNDVFLKACDTSAHQDFTDGENKSGETIPKDAWPPVSHGLQRGVDQFSALIKKRCYFLKKKFYWFIPTIVVSICIFLLAMWLGVSNSNYYSAGGPSMNYSLQVYGKPKIYYGGEKSSDPFINNLRRYYSEAVLHEHGESVYTENISDGIIKEGVHNIAFYKRHMITATEFNSTIDKNRVVVNAMYSAETLHGIPISINLAMNAIAKALLGNNFSIATSNSPLKQLYSQHTPSELSVVSVASVWLILIPISMFFFMSNFIIFPNTEVSTNFIQIQTIAGIKTYFYWLTNIFFDILFSVPPLAVLFSLLCVVNWLFYNTKAFSGADITAMIVMYGTYIIVALPFTYLFSFRPTITGGFTLILMLGIFCGIIPSLIIILIEFSQQEYYIKIADCIKPVLIAISPQFALSYISVKFSKKYVENFNWKYMDPNKRNHICNTDPNPCCYGGTSACSKYQDYYRNETMGIQNELALMGVSFVVYFALLTFLNSDCCKKLLHFVQYPVSSINMIKKGRMGNEDNEKLNQDNPNASLQVNHLRKTFGDKVIVNNLKFYLKNNKCFGLLGVNGAGKSTTFRMLTKNLFFDNGEITLKEEKDKFIKINQQKYCQQIGYCPQEDCLNFFLTGRELIRTMARLKGYSGENVETVTENLLLRFDLKSYADQPCAEYSGGNKRKLSTCMAFLGSPKVICLDEPTSGVDPASRRKFWNILSLFKDRTSFLLCSHSMEECENLCDEIAIMKSGEIKDQGSLLHLKNKYKKGFKVTVTLKDGGNSGEIKKYVSEKINAHLKDEYANTLTYQVEDVNKRLSGLFSDLEDMKNTYQEQIEDYAVNQISLEDIFLTVAQTS